MPLLRLVAERSSPALIHVDLWGAGDLREGYPFVSPHVNPDVRYPNLSHSLKSLSPHIHRCQRFKVFITDSDAASAFAQLPFTTANRLEELEVATQCSQDVDDRIFSALRELVALRKLALIGFGGGSTIRGAISVIRWHQLLHLNLSYPISTEEVFWLLQACTSAVTMRIKAKMQVGYDGPSVHAPNLQTLSLSVCGRNTYRSLRKVEAPNIEVFRLETRREASIYETPAEIPSDDQFVWPSVMNKGRSLRILVINDPDSPYVDAVEMLSNEYIKAVPVVQIGIRPAEMFYAQRNPQFWSSNSRMLGWIDESTMREYRTKGGGLLSSAGIPFDDQ